MEEAEAEGRGTRRGIDLVPIPGQPPLLEAVAWGETIRITLVRRRDGFQPFPDRISVRLDVIPARKC